MSMTSLPEGYRAIVIGASGGIGCAVAEAIGNDPRCGNLVSLSRRHDGLDVTDENSVADIAAKLEGQFPSCVLCDGWPND